MTSGKEIRTVSPDTVLPAAGPVNAPVWFLSHGAPTTVLSDDATTAFWAGLETALDGMRAILMISAHWETAAPVVSAATRPETIHDFYGFPEALYELHYRAPGAPEVAAEVARLLRDDGIETAIAPDRGLDHGAWTPLYHARPKADIPVLQLSIQPHRGSDWHLRLGAALEPLTRQGIAVIGSGGAVHNVPDAMQRLRGGHDETPEWAALFNDRLCALVASGDAPGLEALLASPLGSQAHPSDEHLMPLFVAMGAGGGNQGSLLHDRFDCGSLAMTAFSFSRLDSASADG
jgi:4,5-DOPA dioxygenase extradiol